MLTYNNKVIRCDDYYIRQLSSGLDELIFTLNIYDPDYKDIWEETPIAADGQQYLVKAIDGGKDKATIKCQIDLDAWKATMKEGYTVTGGVATIVNAIKPSGWTVVNDSGISGNQTLEEITATPYDIMTKLRELWPELGYRFDTSSKTVTLGSVTNGQNLGAFVTRQLNLRKIEYKGKSSTFATRLYATGKDGLTFASINGGKSYVENKTYSNKTICAYMKDDRMETAQALLTEAQTQLASICVPQRSYSCDVVDLAAASGMYSNLDFPLFSRVTLIDDTKTNSGILHSVVERWVYPNDPAKNKVVLSTVAPRITTQLTSVINAINKPFSTWQLKQQAIQQVLTAILLGAHGGSVRLLDTDNDGEPDTLYIADDPDPTKARKVWRFNYEGWGGSTNGFNGPFSIGAAFGTDGWATLYADVLKVVNIDADNITTGSIDASVIDVTNIDADNITSGSIDARVIDVININASSITAGTLSVDRIQANSIEAGKLSGGVNTSLGYANFSDRVFNNNATASYMNCSALIVGGHQFTEQTIGIIDGTGTARYFTGLFLVGDTIQSTNKEESV